MKSGAHGTAVLVTGPPNPNGDFLKTVMFDIDTTDLYTACVLVTGNCSIRDSGSFGLPTHEPLMVLRDPPGLLSHASCKNVHATLRPQSETDQTHHGFDLDVEAGFIAGADAGVCGGGGFRAIFLECSKTFEADSNAFPETGGGGDFPTTHSEKHKAGSHVTTWSHQTSDDQWNPGSAADAFIVPNLNVKCVEALKIGWNVPNCSATNETVFMFDLESQANKPALSFVTMTNTKKAMIPKLEEIIANLNATLRNSSISQNTSSRLPCKI